MGGLVQFVENSAIPEPGIKPPPAPDLDNLSVYLMSAWNAALEYKQPVELKMLEMIRQRSSLYTPKKVAEIKAMGLSEVFIPVTRRKCRDAQAWIMDIVKPLGEDKAWSLDPTPVPDLPPELLAEIESEVMAEVQPVMDADLAAYGAVQPETAARVEQYIKASQERKKNEIREEAKERAFAMETLIEDKLTESGFQGEFTEFLNDLVGLKAGILKGPVYRKRLTQQGWVQGVSGWAPNYIETECMDVDRVDPFRFFVGPNAGRLQYTYTVEWHDLTGKQLQELKGVEGYSDEAINRVLGEYGNGAGRWINSKVLAVFREARMGIQERTTPAAWDDSFDALEFWIPISGKMLGEWNIPDLDEMQIYDVNCWLVNDHVIKCVINPDKLGRNPYAMTSFIRENGTVWGTGLPETIEDDQAAINMLGRAVCNNAAFASMPQISVNAIQLAKQDDGMMRPGKVWKHDGGSMTGDDPIRFFQPPVVVSALIGALEMFMRQADADSGVPAYAHGDSQVGGAGNTASGLSMLISMASRGIYSVVTNISNDVLSPLITRFYDALMLHHKDDKVKGDAKIVASGVAALMQREQAAVRLNEFAAMTLNPVDSPIIGVKGRTELLRALASRLDLPVDKIIPGDDEMAKLQGLLQQSLQPQPGGMVPGAAPGGRATDMSGMPVSGQDAALFSQ